LFPSPLLDLLRSWIEEADCQAYGFEEAGCQARGLKKQVVMPLRKSLQVRGCWGSDFPKGISTTSIVLSEFLSSLLLKPWKGSGAAQGLLSREGENFLGWDRHVGNETLHASCNSWHLGRRIPTDY